MLCPDEMDIMKNISVINVRVGLTFRAHKGKLRPREAQGVARTTASSLCGAELRHSASPLQPPPPQPVSVWAQ